MYGLDRILSDRFTGCRDLAEAKLLFSRKLTRVTRMATFLRFPQVVRRWKSLAVFLERFAKVPKQNNSGELDREAGQPETEHVPSSQSPSGTVLA